MGRFLLGGFVGGLVIFAWSAVAHLVLPLGQEGFVHLPDDARARGALQGGFAESGMYLLPQFPADGSKEEKSAWESRWRSGPTALVVYRRDGAKPPIPDSLVMLLGSSLVAAFIIAIVLVRCDAPYLGRVLIVALLGTFAWLTVDVSYWVRFRFPDDYVIARAIDLGGGWLLTGLVMARVVESSHA